MHRSLLILSLLLAFLCWPRCAQAATSYDGCTGYLTETIVTVDSGGTWCLKSDLQFSPLGTKLWAVYVSHPDVTIDCNGFRIYGQLAQGGEQPFTIGIFSNMYRVTVRNCDISGFYNGIDLEAGYQKTGAFLVENNRLEGNIIGIAVRGSGSIIRHNLVFDSIGNGIMGLGGADILENSVAGGQTGVTISSNMGSGIVSDAGGRVQGNDIRGLVKPASGTVTGIDASTADRVTIRNNTFTGDGSAGSNGVVCGSGRNRVLDNVVSGFATGLAGCSNPTGNDVSP